MNRKTDMTQELRNIYSTVTVQFCYLLYVI